jgi:multimeric flavodoxin WrbA/putative sterol carrier protein
MTNSMKVLLLRSYPRKNGYTARCADLFTRGLLEGGADIADMDISGIDFKHCRGCYSCWLKTPGKCVFNDGMSDLHRLFLDTETTVFVTPLNAYGINSHLKIFMDRTFALTKPGFEVSSNGLVRNLLRYPEAWPKRLAAIAVGAFRGEENFYGLVKSIELYANGMNMDYAGTIIRPESYLMQFELAKPKTVKLIEAAFVKAGYELATGGRFSEKTLSQANLPLSSGIDHFKRYSNIYWEHAVNMGADAEDLSALQKKVTSDVRILMYEMARSADPSATARLKAVFQFDFADRNLFFRIAIDRGNCLISEGKTENPDIRITCSSDTWARIFTREINARDALMSRQIILSGDKSLFSRLDRYFPPPVM